MPIIRKQRRFGKIFLSGTGTATKLPITSNTAPSWLLAPDVRAIQGIATQIVIVSANVIDPNAGQTVTITYIGASLSGTGWSFVPGPVGTARYVYDGVGTASTVYGLRLRATDNGSPNLYSDSPIHTGTISSATAQTTDYLTLFDGVGGATQIWWNALIEVPWDNLNGDYLDSAQTPNPSSGSPYATFTVSQADVATTANSTQNPLLINLVERWRSNGNTGMYLKTGGSTSLWMRGTAYPPSMTVTISGTPYTLACTASCSLIAENDTFGPQSSDGRTYLQSPICLQFDLSSLPALGSVQSASLTVYGQGFLGSTFSVYELNPPNIWTAASESPRAQELNGISETDVATNGNVIFYDLFPSDWTAQANNTADKWFIEPESIANLSYQIATHATSGINELKFDYTNQTSGSTPAYDRSRGGFIMGHNLYNKAVALGQNPDNAVRENAYSRAAVTFYDTRIYSQGEKIGLAMEGRMGGLDGNGGNNSHGIFIPRYVAVKNTTAANATTITLKNFPKSWTRMNRVTNFIISEVLYTTINPPTETDANGEITVSFSPPLAAQANADAVVSCTAASWFDGTPTRYYTQGGVQGAYSGWSARVNSQQLYINPIVTSGDQTVGASTIKIRCSYRNSAPIVYPGDTLRLGGSQTSGGTTYTVTGASPIGTDANGEIVVPVTPAVVQNFGDNITFYSAHAINKRLYELDQNPYKHLIGFMINFYNPQADQSGNGWFTTPTTTRQRLLGPQSVNPTPLSFEVGSRASGWPRIPIGQQVSITLRCVMNTLQNDPDMFGNCTPNADGIMELWVDGVKVMSCSELIYRRHPGIKIESPLWLDWYVGGDSQPTIVQQTRRGHGGAIAATSYIAPVSSRPAWRNAIQPWTINNITDEGHTLASVYEANPTWKTYDARTITADFVVDKLNSWSAGIFAPDAGNRGKLLWGQDGHSKTGGSPIFSFDIDSRQWEGVISPWPPFPKSTGPGYVPPAGTDLYYDPGNTAGYPIWNGDPQSATEGQSAHATSYGGWSYPVIHSTLGVTGNIIGNYAEYYPNVPSGIRYGATCILPQSFGGEAGGTWMFANMPHSHIFPGNGPTHGHFFGLTTKTWLPRTNNSAASVGMVSGGAAAAAAFSEKYGKMVTIQGGSDAGYIIDPSTKLFERYYAPPYLGQYVLANSVAESAIITNDHVGHLLITVAYSGLNGNRLLLLVHDLDEMMAHPLKYSSPYAIGAADWTETTNARGLKLLSQPVTLGYPGALNSQGDTAFSITYSRARKTIYVWQTPEAVAPQTWDSIYNVNPFTGTPKQPPSYTLHTIVIPDNWQSGTWTVTQRSLSLGNGYKPTTSISRQRTQIFSFMQRFAYDESLDGCWLWNNQEGPVQFIPVG